MALKNSWTAGEAVGAADLNDVANEILGINASGVYASLPTVGHPGRLYFCTDIDLVLRDNGTTWIPVHIGSEGGVPTAPPTSSWSTTTLGSATFAADKDGRLHTNPSAAGNNCRTEYRTLTPTSNYTFTAYLESSGYGGATGWSAGIVLRNSGSGSLVTFGPSLATSITNAVALAAYKWTSPTAFSATYASTAGYYLTYGMPKWLRVRDDATTRFLEYSYNGVEWILHYSVGRTDFITPDQVGWFSSNDTTGVTGYVRLRSFSVV